MFERSLTRVTDLTPLDIQRVLTKAFSFKRKHEEGVRRENVLDGKVVALLFEKPSLRTKVAFEVATHYLGGQPIFLSSSQILASGGNERGRESIPDIARNLERFCDLIVARVYHHEVIDEIAQAVRTPVINALCDKHHPTQALADLMAIQSVVKKDPRDISVAFVGDGNNVATSLMQICLISGINFRIATPGGYEIPLVEHKVGEYLARGSGATYAAVHDPAEAVRGADVVYTDTFTSMGQEGEKAARSAAFVGYQVNADLMGLASREAAFMHCLPAHRGEEVTDEVMDSPQSIVFDQAECRLHVAKALIASYLS
jgi:ornithine carbamoyltransferase